MDRYQLEWEEARDNSGFLFWRTRNLEFTAFRSQAFGVPYFEFFRGKQLVGFFPDQIQGWAHCKKCLASGVWPEKHVDLRVNLDEIRAFVAKSGEEYRIKMEAEDARRKAAEALALANQKADLEKIKAALDKKEAERAARKAEYVNPKVTKKKPKKKVAPAAEAVPDGQATLF